MEQAKALTPAQALEHLAESYRAFLAKLEQSRASSMGEAMSNYFRAQGNPRVSYAVEEFDITLTRQLSKLAQALDACPAEERMAAAAQALEQMLFYPVPRDRTAAFSLAAFEGRAIALVPFLTPDQRRQTAARYTRRNPPRQMLPNQKKLWSALCQP